MPLASEQLNNFKLKILLELFDHIRCGSLVVTLPSGDKHKFKGPKNGVDADIHIKSLSCINAFLKQGDIGLGESFMEGDWTTSNLSNLLIFFTANLQAIEEIIHGRKVFQFFWKISHFLNRNSKSGSKRNIYKHYDLGNDFYQLWLDPSMTYSSGIFLKHKDSLEDAQSHKYNRILKQLGGKKSHILEIGCGWGGFAEKAASKGHKVTCLTLSPAQASYARDRMKKAKLDHLVTIKICDYRDMHDEFDHIVSIEMIEAVGMAYWETYFETLKKCLKPGGKAVIQGITIDDEIFEGYQHRVDFIQKHIFPGGVLMSKRIFNELSMKEGFNRIETFEFGPSYSKTLYAWLDKFNEVQDDVKKLGFPESFIRKWQFYLSYCIAGFETKQTDVVQFTLQRPKVTSQNT